MVLGLKGKNEENQLTLLGDTSLFHLSNYLRIILSNVSAALIVMLPTETP